MKKSMLFSAVALVACSLIAAESTPKDEVAGAAKKLANQSNYSWKTTTEFGNFESTTDGKAEKGGATMLTMSFGDNDTEAVLQGDKGAIKQPDAGWQSLAELEADTEPGPGRFLAGFLRNFKAPAAQAEDLVSKTKELKKDGDAYSSDLTEDGAKSLLTFRGRRGGQAPPPPQNAKGSVKFWLKDGALTKYELHLSGTVNFGGEDRDVDRTMTVEIKDVGTTKVNVPAEAKKKLT